MYRKLQHILLSRIYVHVKGSFSYISSFKHPAYLFILLPNRDRFKILFGGLLVVDLFSLRSQPRLTHDIQFIFINIFTLRMDEDRNVCLFRLKEQSFSPLHPASLFSSLLNPQ